MRHSIGIIGALAIVTVVAGGCGGFKGILFKEYSAFMPKAASSSLAGKSIYVKAVPYKFDITQKLEHEALPKREDWQFVKMEKEQRVQWDDEVAAAKEGKTKEDFTSIGWVRNLYGMHIADIRGLNEPSDWVKQIIELNTAEQGATILPADKAAEADLGLIVTVKFLKVDIYMAYWTDLMVDVQFEPKGQPAFTKTYHISAKQMSWSGSAFEFFQPIRLAGQWLMLYLLPDLEKVMAGESVAMLSAM